MISGVPEVMSGVNIGFTDFSEFTVAAGLPTGITAYGISSSSPTTVAIANDAAEGNYFSMSGQGVQGWGYGLDAFDSLVEFGELLARVFINIGVSDRTGLGPVFSLIGFVGEPEPSPDINFAGGGSFRRTGTDFEAQVWTTINGGGNIPISANIDEDGDPEGLWAWVRVRRTANVAVPANDNGRITVWTGSMFDEPTIDGLYSGQPAPVRGVNALGWGMQQFTSTKEQRIAYLSFSEDPTLFAPPLPAYLSWTTSTTIACSTCGNVWDRTMTDTMRYFRSASFPNDGSPSAIAALDEIMTYCPKCANVGALKRADIALDSGDKAEKLRTDPDGLDKERASTGGADVVHDSTRSTKQ